MSKEELIAVGVIRFGLTPCEVGRLSFVEFRALMREWIKMQKEQAQLQRNVVLNAIYNSKRKSGSRIIELFEQEKRQLTPDEAKKEREELFGTKLFRKIT